MRRLSLLLILILFFSSLIASTEFSVEEGHAFHLDANNTMIEMGKDFGFDSMKLYSSRLELNSTNISAGTGNSSLNVSLEDLDTGFPEESAFIEMQVEFNGSEADTTTLELEGLPSEGDFELEYSGTTETVSATSSLTREISDSDFNFSATYKQEDQQEQDSEEDSGGSGGGGGGFAAPEEDELKQNDTGQVECLSVDTESLRIDTVENSTGEVEVFNGCESPINLVLEARGLERTELETGDLELDPGSSLITVYFSSLSNSSQGENGTIVITSENSSRELPLIIEARETPDIVVERAGEEILVQGAEGTADLRISRDGKEFYRSEIRIGEGIQIPENLSSGNYTISVSGEVNGRKIEESSTISIFHGQETRKKPEIPYVPIAGVSIILLATIVAFGKGLIPGIDRERKQLNQEVKELKKRAREIEEKKEELKRKREQGLLESKKYADKMREMSEEEEEIMQRIEQIEEEMGED